MRRFSILLVVSLLAALVPLSWIVTSQDLAYLYRDISAVVLPAMRYWVDTVLSEGRVPLWNYGVFGGMAFWADSTYAPLYPLNVIYVFFPQHLPQAYAIFIAVHLFLLFWAVYWVARSIWDYSFESSTLAGLFVVWCGYTLSVVAMQQLLIGLVGAFAFIASWHRVLCKRGNLRFFLSSAFLSLPIFGGDPQICLILFLLAFFWTVCRAGWKIAFIYSLWLGLLTFLVSAVQLLPNYVEAKSSVRGIGNLSLTEIETWSLHPKRLWELVWPDVYGSITDLGRYVGSQFINGPDPVPFVQTLFLGAVPIALLLAVFPYIFAEIPRKRWTWVAIAAFTIVFFLSLGKFAPFNFYSWAAEWIPFWRAFRFPERLAMWWIAPLLLLAPLALSRRISSLWLMVLAAAVGWIFVASLTQQLPLAELASTTCVVVLIVFLLLWLKESQWLQPRLVFYCLVALSASHTWIASTQWISAHPAVLAEETKVIATIKDAMNREKEQILSGGARRVWVEDHSRILWDSLRKMTALDDVGRLSYHYWRDMVPNVPSYFSLEDAFGYSAVVPLAKKRIFEAMSHHKDAFKSFLGVRFILYRSAEGWDWRVNPSALPYLYCVSATEDAEDYKQTLRRLNQNLSKVLTRELAFVFGFSGPKNYGDCEIQILERTSQRLSLRVRPKDGPAFLVWNESYSPAWKVLRKNNLFDVDRVNGHMMGTIISSAGEVSFVYENSAIKWGLRLWYFWLFLGFIFLIEAYTGSRFIWIEPSKIP